MPVSCGVVAAEHHLPGLQGHAAVVRDMVLLLYWLLCATMAHSWPSNGIAPCCSLSSYSVAGGVDKLHILQQPAQCAFNVTVHSLVLWSLRCLTSRRQLACCLEAAA